MRRKQIPRHKKISWLKEKGINPDTADLDAVALQMMAEGLFSPHANVSDIKILIKKAKPELQIGMP